MIQIDMKMPKTYADCPFVVYHKYYSECYFTGEIPTTTKRQCKCPLLDATASKEDK